MGGIGRDLKKKAEAFGIRVQYHNRRKLPEDLAGGAKYVDFEELLATSDIISLNLPLNVRQILMLPLYHLKLPFENTSVAMYMDFLPIFSN